MRIWASVRSSSFSQSGSREPNSQRSICIPGLLGCCVRRVSEKPTLTSEPSRNESKLSQLPMLVHTGRCSTAVDQWYRFAFNIGHLPRCRRKSGRWWNVQRELLDQCPSRGQTGHSRFLKPTQIKIRHSSRSRLHVHLYLRQCLQR